MRVNEGVLGVFPFLFFCCFFTFSSLILPEFLTSRWSFPLFPSFQSLKKVCQCPRLLLLLLSSAVITASLTACVSYQDLSHYHSQLDQIRTRQGGTREHFNLLTEGSFPEKNYLLGLSYPPTTVWEITPQYWEYQYTQK